jgi:hypothetical protein
MVAINEPSDRPGKRGPTSESLIGGTSNLVAQLKDTTAAALQSVKSQATVAARQIEQSAGELTHTTLAAVRDGAKQAYDQRKTQAVARLTQAGKVASKAAGALRAVEAGAVADYVEAASQRAGHVAEYLEEHNLTQMIDDAGDLVRRNRAVAVGGMLVVGFALTRFLKASGARAAAAADADEDRGGKRAGRRKDKGKSARKRDKRRGESRPTAAADPFGGWRERAGRTVRPQRGR